MSDPDDPLDPKRWTASGDGGRITGDELAYLKDLIAHQLGVGNSDSEFVGTQMDVPAAPPEPPPPPPPEPQRTWWQRLWRNRFRD